MNLIQYLACSRQDEFREGRPKSLVVPETIDAVLQLILQDRHVTYREIEIVRIGSHTICQSLKKLYQSEWQKCLNYWYKRIQSV